MFEQLHLNLGFRQTYSVPDVPLLKREEGKITLPTGLTLAGQLTSTTVKLTSSFQGPEIVPVIYFKIALSERTTFKMCLHA